MIRALLLLPLFIVIFLPVARANTAVSSVYHNCLKVTEMKTMGSLLYSKHSETIGLLQNIVLPDTSQIFSDLTVGMLVLLWIWDIRSIWRVFLYFEVNYVASQAIAVIILFCFVNVLKTLLTKKLASHFHKETFFEKMQLALRKVTCVCTSCKVSELQR